MPAIALIHGFLIDDQKAKPEFGNITVTETVLVETTSPLVDLIDLLNDLPAGSDVTAINPKGIGFTFEVSTHPDAAVLVLREAGDVARVGDTGVFWNIQLVYKIHEKSTAQSGQGQNPKERKDQVRTDPISRPTIWSTSSQIVQKQTYKKANGAVIVHTNGLPITEPYAVSIVHTTHSFSLNLNYAGFDHSDYAPYVGDIGTAPVFGIKGSKVKLTSLSANEEYESAGTGVNKTTYHLIRMNLTFEINPDGWDEDAKMVSRSTLQKIAANDLVPINVNSRDYATEPWPLDAAGLGIPYDAFDPAKFGFLDTGYPRTGNLAALVAALGLFIP